MIAFTTLYLVLFIKMTPGCTWLLSSCPVDNVHSDRISRLLRGGWKRQNMLPVIPTVIGGTRMFKSKICTINLLCIWKTCYLKRFTCCQSTELEDQQTYEKMTNVNIFNDCLKKIYLKLTISFPYLKTCHSSRWCRTYW